MTDSKELCARLRGEYRIPITDGLGAAGGNEPDNPNEFVRHFVTPPIQKEAATLIEQQAAEIERLREQWTAFERIVAYASASEAEEMMAYLSGKDRSELAKARATASYAASHLGLALKETEEVQAKLRRARESLNNLLRGSQIHFFSPRGHENELDRDTCQQCGHNLRHENHMRAQEGHPADILREAIIFARTTLKEIGDE